MPKNGGGQSAQIEGENDEDEFEVFFNYWDNTFKFNF
jgi:hypothetical protein